jgi:threonine dehydratase
MNKMRSLSDDELKRGVVASSAGNHAQGVAYSATECGTKAHIVMPVNSPLVKVMATQGYGAEVILHGEIYDESYAHARELEKEKGLVFVHPYEDDKVIAGQGTIGLELLEALPELDSVVVPIGGGGLISGIATAIKSLKPECRVYGAVAENNPGMFNLYHGFHHNPGDRKPTIADGLAVKKPSPHMLETYIKPLVDDVATVSEDEIAESIVFLLERAKTVVEGSGAVGLAAAVKMKEKWNLGQKTCIVLCGGNIDMNAVSKVIERGLAKKGRLVRLAVIVPDKPGTLFKLTSILAAQNANVIQVEHDRLKPHLEINEAQIEFLLETRDENHISKIQNAFKEAGIRLA